MKRVVITGVGLVTPLGVGTKYVWNRLINAESGIRKVPDFLFDTSDLPTKIAGLVQDGMGEGELNLDNFIEPKDQRKMDRFIHHAMAAASFAIEDAGVSSLTDEQKLRAGVLVGSGIGGLMTIDNNSKILAEQGPRRISPFFIPSCLINLASGQISIKYGLKGPNHAVVTACSTGAHAIGDAMHIIARGDADMMVAGGAEASVCRLGVAGFNACKALSTSYNDTPEKASRPWDNGRDGFVMGEGAGVLVLEEYEHAKARGAKIYAEVVGYGLSGDAYHITAPESSGDGGYRSMQMALQNARIAINKIDYINAHGTSTPLGDMIELAAVRKLLGSDVSKVAMSSTKSAIGHLLGAAGSVEAIFSVLALEHGVLPPTLNLENKSEGCEDMNLVPLVAQKRKIEYALSNSFGFGGTNASLIFKKL